MSHYDDRMIEIAARRVAGRGRNVEIYRATETSASSVEPRQDGDTEATQEWRFKSGCCLVLGLLLCATPLLPLGAALAVVSSLLLLFSPAVEKAELNMHTETRRQVAEGSGIGLGALLWACIVGLFWFCVAMGIGGVVLLAMLGG